MPKQQSVGQALAERINAGYVSRILHIPFIVTP